MSTGIHARIGLERVELAYLGGIVVNEICAATDADLKNLTLRPRHDAFTNFPNGSRIAQQLHETGVDVISVEGHSHLPATEALSYGSILDSQGPSAAARRPRPLDRVRLRAYPLGKTDLTSIVARFRSNATTSPKETRNFGTVVNISSETCLIARHRRPTAQPE